MTKEEEQKAFKGYQQVMIDEDAKQQAEKDKCLVFVKNLVSKPKFDEILEVIEESGCTTEFKLKNKPLGEYQDEDLEFLKGYYVDQTTDGGYIGDDFAGTVSIEYNDEQYLQFSYSM